MKRLLNNKKGQIGSETVAFIITILLIVIGIFIWQGIQGKGPLRILETLMPNLEKPKVEFPTKLEGLIKYDLVNDNLQYYKDVQFEEPTALADGSKAFFINGNVLKYDEFSYAIRQYYFVSSSRGSDSGIVLVGSDSSSSFSTLFNGVKGSADIDVRIVDVCDSLCAATSRSGDEFKQQIGDIIIKAESKSLYDSNVLSADLVLRVSGQLYVLGTNKEGFVSEILIDSGSSYAQKIVSHATSWRDSVLSKPITLRVYNANGQSIGNVCKEYSAPVMKVSSLSGAGFDLNADLSKASYVGECK